MVVVEVEDDIGLSVQLILDDHAVMAMVQAIQPGGGNHPRMLKLVHNRFDSDVPSLIGFGV